MEIQKRQGEFSGMLTIGVDCRKINDGGIGTYLQNLLKQWFILKVPAKFFLFCNPRDKKLFKLPHDFAEPIVIKTPKYSISELFSFSKPLTDIKADIFFTPHYTLGFKLPCPSIVTIHDLIHIHFKPRFGLLGSHYAKFMINHAGKSSAVILTVSENTKNDIQRHFPKWSYKVRIVYPAVDTDIFNQYPPNEVADFKRIKSLPDDFMLYAGALKHHKNPQALVEIVNKLKFPLVIATQDKREFNNEILPALNDKKMMNIISIDSYNELAILYNCARLFVFPSLYEGFGLPPLEAMACGLPVVCSNRASLPEVVGDSALMFSPDNLSDMLTKVNLLWHDDSMRDKLRTRGLERVHMFDWSKSARTIFEILNEVVES
jgi:glycosyltransferase involved in cell wall biosynthesis